jgi:hypothetical protein
MPESQESQRIVSKSYNGRQKPSAKGVKQTTASV